MATGGFVAGGIGVGRPDWVRAPLPPNRASGSPAHGPPVDGPTSVRIERPWRGRSPDCIARARQRRRLASECDPIRARARGPGDGECSAAASEPGHPVAHNSAVGAVLGANSLPSPITRRRASSPATGCRSGPSACRCSIACGGRPRKARWSRPAAAGGRNSARKKRCLRNGAEHRLGENRVRTGFFGRTVRFGLRRELPKRGLLFRPLGILRAGGSPSALGAFGTSVTYQS